MYITLKEISRLALLVLFLFFGTKTYAQKVNIPVAVLLDTAKIGNYITNNFRNQVKERLSNGSDGNYQVYDWSTEKSTFSRTVLNKPELPSRLIMFLRIKGDVNPAPGLNVRFDTLGKVVGAHYILSCKILGDYKVVDLTTGEILIYRSDVNLTDPNGLHLEIKDIDELKGITLASSQTSPGQEAYKKAVFIINNRHSTEVKKRVEEMANPNGFFIQNNLYAPLLALKNNVETHFKIDFASLNLEKKTKRVVVKAGVQQGISKDTKMSLFQIDTLKNGEVYFRNEHYYTDLFVDEVKQDYTTLYPLAFFKNELTDEFRKDTNFYAIRSEDLNMFTRWMAKNKVKINIATNDRVLFNNASYLTSLMSIPCFRLIERNAPEMKYFTDMYKREENINLASDGLNYSPLGVEYIVDFSSIKSFNIIDVKTTKILVSESYIPPGIFSLSLRDPFKEMIFKAFCKINTTSYAGQVIEVIEAKKDKVKTVYADSPIGIYEGLQYDLVLLQELEVNGAKSSYTKKIGEGEVKKKLYPTGAFLKVTDGGDDLFKALESKSKIYLICPASK